MNILEIGLEQGRKLGMELGREEGREEGLAQGLEQGLEQGLKRYNSLIQFLIKDDRRDYPKVCVNLQTDVR